MTIDPNAHDRFVLRQRIRPVLNQYEISLSRRAGRAGVLRRAGALQVQGGHPLLHRRHEDGRAHAADGASAVRPARPLRHHRRRGAKIGEIQKVFGESLLRSTYRLYDASGEEVAFARERSVLVALVRRAVGCIPYIGDFADWLPIPYHFDFVRDGEVIGRPVRRTGMFKLRDVYDIDVSGDRERTLDRRLVLANAVGMDALQAR